MNGFGNIGFINALLENLCNSSDFYIRSVILFSNFCNVRFVDSQRPVNNFLCFLISIKLPETKMNTRNVTIKEYKIEYRFIFRRRLLYFAESKAAQFSII